MNSVEEILQDFPKIKLDKDELLINQDQKIDTIYFLAGGKVNVVKDDYVIATIAERFAVFGEMSVLLDIEHTASIVCVEPSEFYEIKNPREFIDSHPDVIWHIAQVLSLRLFNLNHYLVDVKRQYEGHDHLKMVDDVLETLLNQQKTNVNKREKSRRDDYTY